MILLELSAASQPTQSLIVSKRRRGLLILRQRVILENPLNLILQGDLLPLALPASDESVATALVNLR